jgi:hypothetical protein
VHRLSLLNWQRHTRRDVRLLQVAFHQRPSVATNELIARVLAELRHSGDQDDLVRKGARGESQKARRARPRALRPVEPAGFIEATPGNVVDYGAIEQRILADAALFQVREIAYDPWNATHIALRLQEEGAAMVEFRQGFRSMAAPTRELEKLIVSRKLAHGANPVTRWMAANVAVAQDRRQSQARQGQVDRAHRRHRCHHHGVGACHAARARVHVDLPVERAAHPRTG